MVGGLCLRWSDPEVAPQAWCICNAWVSIKAVWRQQAQVGVFVEDVGSPTCHLFGVTLRCPRFSVSCSVQKRHGAGLCIATQLLKSLHSPTVCIALAITACDGGFFHQLDLCFHLSYFARTTIFKVAIFELLSFAFTCPPSPLHCH